MNAALIRYRAVHNMVLRMLGSRRSWSDAAVNVEVIQNEEEEPTPPLYVLSGQLELATAGVPGHSTLAEELEMATKKSATHAPVIRYTLRDCLVYPHGVEFSGGSIRKSGGRLERVPSGPIEEIPRAAYCMNSVSHQYFGHWLTDACTTALLARPEDELLLDIRRVWPHAQEYAQAFELQPLTAANVWVRELSVFQDFSQGSSKRRRYPILRDRATRHFGDTASTARPIYLRRGGTGVARMVSNEVAVMQRLEREGFRVLDVASLSSAEIFKSVANAPVVISMDGSHMTHLYFAMRRGSSLLSFIPADRFTAVHAGYAAAFGIHFGMLVTQRDDVGYAVDVDAMMRTLSLFPL